MKKRNFIPFDLSGEVGAFILIWLVYLILPYVVIPDRYGYTLGFSELVIKSVYLVPILLNNIVMIPRLLYRSWYWLYGMLLLALVFSTGLFEELVLENIFYPTTRGGDFTFGGVQYAASKIGFVVGLFSSFKLLWDYQKKQQQVSELEQQRVESELKFLKSQVNPHVLFNNLNNIYSYALEKSEKVPAMLLKLSEIMRYMLHDATESMVPLEKEISYLENFIELQKLRLEDRGSVQFVVDGSPGNLQIAPLLLVSFVENSFKHSMKSEEEIIIGIVITISNGQLKFNARNNYSETIMPDPDRHSGGIGLQNVRKRLELIYGDQYGLSISQEDGEFVVDLTLNLLVDEPEVLDY